MLTRGGGRLTICSRSSAASAWLTKENGEQHASNIQWRGRSNATSAPDIPNPQKQRKTVSKDQRRAMLESYVDEYRDANVGKFPSAAKAREKVGGSYYVVKQILQELEYNSKMDPLTNGAKTLRRNETSKNRKSVIEIRDFPSQGTIYSRKKDAAEAISSRDAEIGENLRDEMTPSHNLLKPAAEGSNPDLVKRQIPLLKKDDQEIPCPPERQEDAGKEVYNDRAKFVSEQTHVKEETKEDSEEGKYPTDLSDVTVEVDRAILEAPEVSTDLDGPNRQEKQHESSTKSDMSIRRREDAEPPQKSSLWGNLKSFADSIISIWRN